MTLRVILQIVPFGVENDAYEIGRLDISNFGNGKNTPGVFDYMYKYGNQQEYSKKVVTHQRDEGAWELVRKVLNDTV